MDEVLQAATMVTMSLFHLGVFHSPRKVHHEFLCDPIDTVGSLLSTSLSFLALSSPRCAKCMAGVLSAGWVPLSLCKGMKLVILGL